MKKQNYISVCTSQRTHPRIEATLSDTQLFLLSQRVIERNQRCNWGLTHMKGVTHIKGVTHMWYFTQGNYSCTAACTVCTAHCPDEI
jgi:hypothetical protein